MEGPHGGHDFAHAPLQVALLRGDVLCFRVQPGARRVQLLPVEGRRRGEFAERFDLPAQCVQVFLIQHARELCLEGNPPVLEFLEFCGIF